MESAIAVAGTNPSRQSGRNLHHLLHLTKHGVYGVAQGGLETESALPRAKKARFPIRHNLRIGENLTK